MKECEVLETLSQKISEDVVSPTGDGANELLCKAALFSERCVYASLQS